MSNYFIGAYLYAYNNHHDIVLSVNDLWAIITMMLSRYINENAEALRTKFVTHTGQKELTVVEYTGCVEQSLAMEKQWDYFFVQILEQIKTNTNPDVVKDIDNDFSVFLLTVQLLMFVDYSFNIHSVVQTTSHDLVVSDADNIRIIGKQSSIEATWNSLGVRDELDSTSISHHSSASLTSLVVRPISTALTHLIFCGGPARRSPTLIL